MTRTVTIATSDPVPRSDTKILPFRIVDTDGDPVNLQGSDIIWELRKRQPYDAAVSLDDDGVSVVERSNLDGEFAIRLEQGATSNLEIATYRERLRIIDTQGNQTTWVGEVPIVDEA